MKNTEIKKQFNELIEKYLQVQEMKNKVYNEMKTAEKKSNWSEYNKKSEKHKYYIVLEQVYETILAIAAKNVIIDAMKEESQKEKNKLLKPIRFKVVQDFLKNILESNKIHCYIDSNSYRTDVVFYVIRTQYNNTWINVSLYDLMENSPSWEERYFDIEKIKSAKFNSLNYNPEEIAKNYIKFMDTAKKELEKFKKKWDEMRNKGTLDKKFIYMGDGKNSISETFYF